MVAAHGLSLVSVSGLLTPVASFAVKHELQVHGLQQLKLSGSLVGHTGLVAPRHVASSWIRKPMSPALAGGSFTTETKDLMVNPMSSHFV